MPAGLTGALTLLAGWLMVLSIACDSTPGPTPVSPTPTTAAAPLALSNGSDESATGDGVRLMEVTVGPELLDCVGVGPRKCLEVDGGLFYEGIAGFKHEEGYTYRLKIERYDAFPGEKEPPQDASRYGYRLIEVMSKTPG